MRALTLIRPMAAAIVHGTKRVENRPMDLPRAMRGVPTVVAVHAGKKWDGGYEQTVIEIDGRRIPPGTDFSRHAGPAEGFTDRWPPKYVGRVRDEGIVGLMLLTGRVFVSPAEAYMFAGGDPFARTGAGRWYSGPFGYEIAAALAFPGPIPCRGMQGFWPVSAAIEEQISMSGAIEDLMEKAKAPHGR